MKRLFSIFIIYLAMLSCLVAYADDDFAVPVELCVAYDVYSVDLVFETVGKAEISDIDIAWENCLFDWNFVESEARLYISLASGTPMKKTKTPITVISNAEISLNAVSARINGISVDLSCLAHEKERDLPQISPSYDSPGACGGKMCGNCGVVLKEHDTSIPPTGAIISATLSDSGVLSIFGGISDTEKAENAVVLCVYGGGRLMKFVDVSSKNQTEFELTLENMNNADTVKIFRWNTLCDIKPIFEAVEAAVKKI